MSAAVKHNTPEPWSTNGNGNVVGADGTLVVSVPRPKGVGASARRDANAKLIAAAPTLADTLLDADTLMQCDCSLLERQSGHLSDCWLPHLHARITTVLRAAGRLP